MKKLNQRKGIELWKKAKKIIPGGNQLLSKRPEMFLPEGWPAYYKKAKGVEVWDLDGKKYIDMCIMGVGTCVLGYNNSEVNKAVKHAIDNGNMSTLNCYEEVELAEKLIELHSWADMVRFSRTGGEACSIAVRIARAASGKNKIAFCGYHGWHDWYLSSNIADDKNLDGHLLPGLEPAGVPRELKNTAIPFNYGDIESLKAIISGNEIGAIIMEVERHKKADVDFLRSVKNIAEKIGAVLIYDEISSGFRKRTGGVHMLYNVHPDIVLLGKAMGNGFPISAIVGKKEVMEYAQKTFISSTYWTERTGYAASLKVIDFFNRNNVPLHLEEVGNYLKEKLQNLFKEKGFKADVVGTSPVPIIEIKEENPLAVKTFFTQEMLKRGYLASTLIYISYSHKKKTIDSFINVAGEVIEKTVKSIKKGDIQNMLEGPVCHSGFKRLI